MAIVTLHLPEVKAMAEKRPEKCSHCGCAILQRWGVIAEPVIDSRLSEMSIYRYQCTGCRKTFQHYPLGISVAYQTDRMRFLCAQIWKIGTSLHQFGGLALYIMGGSAPTVQEQSIGGRIGWLFL